MTIFGKPDPDPTSSLEEGALIYVEPPPDAPGNFGTLRLEFQQGGRFLHEALSSLVPVIERLLANHNQSRGHLLIKVDALTDTDGFYEPQSH